MAQDYPALHDVTGVAANDVLNIRAEPNAGADLRGALAPTATDIEVVALSEDGKWARIGDGEANGWVALRFLDRHDGQDGLLLSQALTCSGTEPFWTVDLPGTGRMTFEDMGLAPASGAIAPATSVNRVDKAGFIARLTGDLLVTGVLTRDLCSDGMSDRVYGLTLDMVVNSPGGDALFSGCCSLR